METTDQNEVVQIMDDKKKKNNNTEEIGYELSEIVLKEDVGVSDSGGGVGSGGGCVDGIELDGSASVIKEALKSTTKTVLTIPIKNNLNPTLDESLTISSQSSFLEINGENDKDNKDKASNNDNANNGVEGGVVALCKEETSGKIPEVSGNLESEKQTSAIIPKEQISVDDQNTTVISIVPPTEKEPEPIASTNAAEDHSHGHAEPKTSRQLFKEKAAAHGGDDSVIFLQNELSQAQAQAKALAQQRPRTASNSLDVTVSRNPSTAGKHEKKIGHRRVDDEGEVTYKKIQSKQIMGSIQLGIQQTVGSLASKPKRDLLMNDFWEMETISFPSEGSSITPAHHYNDFRFKVYAPIAFRYFRDLFGIAPEDFLMSMCSAPLRQLSNPGASGSLFYLTDDDEFIIKTVQKKECEFLQKLLPGYYMNLSQNPRTLLPKFFGLYCFHYNAKNVRLVAMNNLLPSDIKMHAKYDLKGSTFRRKASKAEKQKASPTFKDLDFMEKHPSGIFLETDKYNALMKTIQRDCMVLESFQIMDYSLLVGIHNLDLAAKEKREERIRNARAKLEKPDENKDVITNDESHHYHQPYQHHHHSFNENQDHYNPISTALNNALVSSSGGGGVGGGGVGVIETQATSSSGAAAGTALNRTRSMNRQRLVAHSTAMESITANMDAPLDEDEDVPAGGIPARSENDERLILYIGIIDILQSYRLEKKLEHTFKSIIYNGDTVSVCRPSFYAQRFQNFMGKTVFKKTPTFPLKHSPSKRKTSTLSTTSTIRTPQRTPSQSISGSIPRPLHHHLSGMSTPPPAFEDIDEEDITATSSTGGGGNNISSSVGGNTFDRNTLQSQKYMTMRSYVSSNRSVLSSGTEDFSDDDLMASGSAAISPRIQSNLSLQNQQQQQEEAPKSPKLSKTKVHVTTIGCSEEELEQIPNDDHDSGNDLSSSTDTPQHQNQNLTSLKRKQQALIQTHLQQIEQKEHYEPENQSLEMNGSISEPLKSNSKTTIINTRAQTYTSTVVVNEVQR